MMTSAGRLFVTVLLTIPLVACGGGGGGDATAPVTPPPTGGTNPPPQPAASGSISIKSSSDGYGSDYYSFDPSNITLKRGGTVSWSNGTGVTHNVTFTAAAGVPQNVADFNSGTASRTFDTAGTYDFQCTHHSGMSGTITVQ